MSWWHLFGILLLAVIVTVGSVWLLRKVNSATLSVTVHEPEPGIHCAVVNTTDGVSIDCWKVE